MIKTPGGDPLLGYAVQADPAPGSGDFKPFKATAPTQLFVERGAAASAGAFYNVEV